MSQVLTDDSGLNCRPFQYKGAVCLAHFCYAILNNGAHVLVGGRAKNQVNGNSSLMVCDKKTLRLPPAHQSMDGPDEPNRRWTYRHPGCQRPMRGQQVDLPTLRCPNKTGSPVWQAIRFLPPN